MKTTFKVARFLLASIGVVSLLMVMLAFTDLPYNAYHDLAVRKDTLTTRPQAIVIMGGDGMPSPNTLMRLYHGAEVANQFKEAAIILAMPYNQSAKDSLRQLKLMAKELVLRSISPQRIVFEPWGHNTRTQAIQIAKMLEPNAPLLIISSPEHMYRALASFRNVGFEKVGGKAGFEVPSDEERLVDKKEQDEEDKVQNLDLRYNMWSYLQYEIIVMREYAAITYYWFKGWI